MLTFESNVINGVPVEVRIIPNTNKDVRPGYAMTPKYVTAHETDNTDAGANADAHAKFLYNQAVGTTSRVACWHITVDENKAIQHIPFDENAWAAGDGGNGTGNRQSIHMELCVNAGGNFEKTKDNAARIAAYLLNRFNIPVSTNFVQHNKWSGKNCPSTIRATGAWPALVAKVQEYQKGVVKMAATYVRTGGYAGDALKEVHGLLLQKNWGYTPARKSDGTLEFTVGGFTSDAPSQAALAELEQFLVGHKYWYDKFTV
ncbi:peptidoglycan recognition protein family protein [Ectobacillus ponti]|uniref:N-acetylmuramoyl-L-alanine amidase n=1 Tax=Ectobacillus ponti TaxID=2961894 RepID=A0AA41XBU5_9BACI|nr:N-acetylmuramoyl-L-alanine amidase [Ectobacillus ponti]MCP8970580.1 N-acetylmuramoyl-L-alanine amidase [Ectobacillus ponti]